MWSNQNITITNATLRSMAKANENRQREKENLTEKNEFVAHSNSHIWTKRSNGAANGERKSKNTENRTQNRDVMYFNYTLELLRNGSPRFIDTWCWWWTCSRVFGLLFYRVATAAITTSIAAAVASLLCAHQIELFLSDLIPSCN